MKDHNIFSSKKHPSHVAQWLRCRFKYLELQGSGVRVPARGVIPTRSLMAIDRFPRGPGGGANLISLLISEAQAFPGWALQTKIFWLNNFVQPRFRSEDLWITNLTLYALRYRDFDDMVVKIIDPNKTSTQFLIQNIIISI